MNLSIESKQVLAWFEELSKIPRKSGNEAGVRNWLVAIAKKNNWSSKTDKVGNIVLKVPATAGLANIPGIVLQGHMDMVCEKTPDSKHDFSKDPIELIYDGDWLRANNTTLGSDNGMGIALALALATAKDIKHPALELLFTTQEETGLDGATGLQPDFISGKYLLNIDSEDEGVFTVGCAGGRNCEIKFSNQRVSAPIGLSKFTLKVSGLRGGHSGVNIKDQRANALKLLFRTASSLLSGSEVFVVSATGGTAHNAIPRDAELVFFGKLDGSKLNQALAELLTKIRNEYVAVDSNLKIELVQNQYQPSENVFTSEASWRLIHFMNSMPHGVSSFSSSIEGLVETSNNLAKIKTAENDFVIVSSQRSSVMSRLSEICGKVESLAVLAGGSIEIDPGYTAWEPNWKSPLLSICKDTYRNLFGKDPVIEVIHAGLECGVIGSKYPGMDMISYGPTIKNPHTPTESFLVTDLDRIWKLSVALLETLAKVN